MKIAFVHPALMDYRVELFNKLSQECDITYIFTNQGRGQSDVKEKHLKIPSEWDYSIVRSNKLKFKNREILTYFKLIREVIKNKYDIILTSTSWYICFPIAKITGKKFIVLTEYWHWSSTPLLRRLLNLITRLILVNSDAVIVTGSKPYEEHLRLGVPKEKISRCIQCSRDYSLLTTKNVRNEFGIGNKKIILFLSRINPIKGLDYLIRAFSLLQKEIDVALIIGGDGPSKEQCEKLAYELDVKNVFFIGSIFDDNIKASYYKECDVFVLPSVFYNGLYEPWGLVVNEIMAFGKPVITTDAVGSAYDLVINDYNGYIVKNKSVHDLYHALHKVLSNPQLALKMGYNSKKIFAEKNNLDNMVKAIIGAINYVQKK